MSEQATIFGESMFPEYQYLFSNQPLQPVPYHEISRRILSYQRF